MTPRPITDTLRVQLAASTRCVTDKPPLRPPKAP